LGVIVPGIFFTSPLVKTATTGPSWADVEAYFPKTQVFANVLLSAYRHQAPERFSPFQPSWAEAYIVTPETPMSGGLFSFPTRRDNTVFLTTDHLTFWLQVSNGSSSNPPTSASAVGVIYDYAPAATFDFKKALKRLDLAVYDEDGTVIGTHQSIQLAGGPDFDEDETRERVLTGAHHMAEREPGSLRLATFEYDAMLAGTDFRVDPSTGRVEPLGDLASRTNPSRA
jgi:hypothetical protein